MFLDPNNPCKLIMFQKPELDNSSIHRQQNNINSSAGMSQPQQFIKTEGGGVEGNMPALSPLSSADLNLTASRYVIQSDPLNGSTILCSKN